MVGDMQIIYDWSEEDRKLYGKTVQVVKHRLNETGLFTDEKLANMLDNHPSEKIDFQYVSDEPVDPQFPDRQLTVDFTGATGKDLIEAAKSDARIWINVREVMNLHPEYKAVLDQIHEELEELTGKNKDRRNCRGGILISSATASTPYHADPTMTHLWHVRGHKRSWIYPVDLDLIPDQAYEAIILGEVDEDMPFNPYWDEKAVIEADLYGGEMVNWPHRSPHRVDNVTYCVSMVMEFSTRESAFTNSGMFTNGILRRKLGVHSVWEKASAPEKFVKAAAGYSLRKIGARKSFRRKDMVNYRLNLSSKDLIEKVEQPYERTH